MIASSRRLARGAASVLLGLLALGGAVGAGRAVVSAGETRVPHDHGHPAAPAGTTKQQPRLLDYIPTYHRDVAPILAENCVGCHTDGGIAPFALDSAESATEHARAAQFAVQAGRMPPWLPAGESPKMRGEHRLTEDEIAVIANWAWAGAPEGKVADARPLPKRAAAPTPDLSVDLGRDFQPDARLTDEYRCFLADPKLAEERYLRAYDIAPGNRRIVHHVLIFQATGRYASDAEELERQSDGRGGWTCFGGPGVGPTAAERVERAGRGGQLTGVASTGPDTVTFVGSWVPGAGMTEYPHGAGLRMRPGSKLVVQVHYNLLGGSGTDRTSARLYFAPRGAQLKPLRLFGALAPVELACPGAYPASPADACHRDAAYERVAAHQEPALTQILRSGLFLGFCSKDLNRFTSAGDKPQALTTSCDFPVNDDRLAIGVQGHMHLLGTAPKLELNPQDPARRRVLLDIPRWDFHWQSSYWYEQPIPISRGDRVRITCTYDNTPGNQTVINGRRIAPRYVVWGEGTTDEMCLAALQTINR